MNAPAGGLLRPHSGKLDKLHRLLDVAIIWFGMDLACLLFQSEFSRRYALAAATASFCFLIVAEISGFYQSWRLNQFRSKIFHMFGVWSVVVIMLVVASFMTKTTVLYSRLVTGSWVILVPAMMLVLEILVQYFLYSLRKLGRNMRTVAFAGDSDLAKKSLVTIEASPWMGLKVIGLYDDRSRDRLSVGDFSVQGNFANLVDDARAGRIDYVYITLPMRAEHRITHLVGMLADTTASVFIVPDLFVFNLLRSRMFEMNDIPVISLFESPFYGLDGWAKRITDVLMTAVIMIFITPLMLAIAIAIKLTSTGPVIFRQRRYGLDGKVIEVWKFRSMTVCEDGVDIPQAKQGDPRITPLGRFLRRTSLDELPQFINVLQGNMSVVGPRPHAVAHNEQYRQLVHGYMLRHKVKPGITGLAQVNGWRGETDTLDKMQKRVESDLQYIQEWSLWLDFKIVLRTILSAFKGNNAF